MFQEGMKTTLHTQQQDTDGGNIQVTQQHAGGLGTDGSTVAGAAVTQQCSGNLQVGQTIQQRTGNVASPEGASAPGTDINTMLLLQLIGQMQSVPGTLGSH